MRTIVKGRATSLSFFIAVTALVLSFSSTSSRADLSPANCSIAQYELLSAYHEFFNFPKDGQLKRKIAEKNSILAECLKTISNKLAPEEAGKLRASQNIMQAELKYNIETLERTGDAERQPVDNMVNHALATTGILGARKDSDNATIDAVRKQAVMIAYLKSRYLERVYSLGGVGLLRDSSAELSIEDLVLEFSKKMDALRKDKSLTANKDAYQKLSAVHVRFNFLQKSMMDYNKTAVPFVVVHHSAFIIKTLLDISNELEQKAA